jgi:phage tail sheath protein FI
MATFLHPGVYVREIPGGTRAIEGVPTSTTIFVGETERGPLTPTRIIGRSQYERIFGGYRRHLTGGESGRVLMPYALDGFFGNGGTQAYVLRAIDTPQPPPEEEDITAFRADGGGAEFVEAASPGAWGNNVSVTAVASTDGDADRFRLAVFYVRPGAPAGDPAEFVENWDRLSDQPNDENYVIDALRRSQYIRWRTDTAASIPTLDNNATQPTEAQLLADAVALTDGVGGDTADGDPDYAALLDTALAEIDDAALLVCAGTQLLPEGGLSAEDFVNLENAFVDYVNVRPRRDLFFVGDLPRLTPGSSELVAGDPVQGAVNVANGAGIANALGGTNFNAAYWPHVEVRDPVGEGRNPTLVIPPAGHIAGLYARIDGRRGVWKAPAGTEARLQGVLALDFEVLDIHQDLLNPRGVNALRRIPSAGLVSWGARTREPTSEWRYVPVRRTAIFLRGSIYFGIQWAVFEPNDARLWQSLRNTIGAFMETQFRNGAFAGATSREAYFVKVDAETTTPDDQAAGVVNILVGFAPLRPAEFVVVSLQQMAGQSR